MPDINWDAFVPVLVVLAALGLQALRSRILASKKKREEAAAKAGGARPDAAQDAEDMTLPAPIQPPPQPKDQPPGFWAQPGDPAYALQQTMKDVCEAPPAPDSIGDHLRAVSAGRALPTDPSPPLPDSNVPVVTIGDDQVQYPPRRSTAQFMHADPVADIVVDDSKSETAKLAAQQRETDLHLDISKKRGTPNAGPRGTVIHEMGAGEMNQRLASQSAYLADLDKRAEKRLQEIREVGENYAKTKLLTDERRQKLIHDGGLEAVDSFIKAAGDEAVRQYKEKCQSMTALPNNTPSMVYDSRDEGKPKPPVPEAGSFWTDGSVQDSDLFKFPAAPPPAPQGK